LLVQLVHLQQQSKSHRRQLAANQHLTLIQMTGHPVQTRAELQQSRLPVQTPLSQLSVPVQVYRSLI